MKLKQVLDLVHLYTSVMHRHPHPVPFPSLHRHQQPLDLIAGVTTEQQQSAGEDNGHCQSSCRCGLRRALVRHWQNIVYIVFTVSLLLNATSIGVVWLHWKTVCPASEQHCPIDSAATQKPEGTEQTHTSVRDLKTDAQERAVSAAIMKYSDKLGAGGRTEKRTVQWKSLLPADVRSRFQYHAMRETWTVPQHGIYLIYSRVSFRGGRDMKQVFRHEIREVKGNNRGQLLHNVVEKSCKSSDVVCHSSILVAVLWLKAEYSVYVVAEPRSLIDASDAQFGIVLISP